LEAARSVLAIFVIDAIVRGLVAILVWRLVQETKPGKAKSVPEQGLLEVFSGYSTVLRDGAFLAFLAASVTMMVVYLQMYGSLSVFLSRTHGVDARGYGYLLTMSAVTVVLLQFGTSRMLRGRPPFLLMAAGTGLYMVGFGMFGLFSRYAWFVVAIIVVTFGEMVVMPTSQALAAGFAPEQLRGRYMATFGLSWSLPATVAPGAAGFILDNFNPNLLWHAGAALCAVSAASFVALHWWQGGSDRFSARAQSLAGKTPGLAE
jgi:MFS family permease